MRRIPILVILLIVGFTSGLYTADAQEDILYSVLPGDTVFRLSLRFGTTVSDIAAANNLVNPNLIFVGQQLRIPQGSSGDNPAPAPPEPPPGGIQEYRVVFGDTLGQIARRFGTTTSAIAAENGIANVNLIFAGQMLRIPVGGSGTGGNTGDTGGDTPPPPPPPPSSPPNNTVSLGNFVLGGQVFNFNNADQMRGAGMSWIKVQARYGRGQLPSSLQGQIDTAHAQGFKILLSVIGEPGELAANPAEYYQEFANFLGGVAALGADAIEVWNEMNIDREWPVGLISGAQYTQMLQAAFNAIKQNNSGTIVISGAPAPTGFFGGCSTSGCDDDRYLQQMAAAGARNFMDCLGVHYNAGITPPTATSGAPVGSSDHYSWYFPRMVDVYARAFPGMPLCFTELGYLSGEGYGPLPAGFSWASGNTVANQAEWLQGAVRLARQANNPTVMIIVWNVNSTLFGEDPQAGYGIIRPDGSCPACNALAVAMQ